MLILDLDNFSLDTKTEIKNEEGKLQYWSQPDFAYKKRVHIYDDKDNEVGYVQYKILSNQSHPIICTKDDNEIDFTDFKIINNDENGKYEIENVAVVKNDNKRLLIEIKDNNKTDKCILFIFSTIEQE